MKTPLEDRIIEMLYDRIFAYDRALSHARWCNKMRELHGIDQFMLGDPQIPEISIRNDEVITIMFDIKEMIGKEKETQKTGREKAT